MVADAAYSNQLAFEERQEARKSIRDSSDTRPTAHKRHDNSKQSNHKRYSSRNLTEAEVQAHWEKGTCYNCNQTGHISRAYPIQDRELLAVVQTLEHYYPEILGNVMEFFVVTDHQALIYYSNKRLLLTRQVRWADFLSNFNITFHYRPGRENVVADALSRKTVDLPTIKAREQEERTLALIPPERIAGPVASISLAEIEDIPHGADLVDLIKTENRIQDLGKMDDRLWVPEKTTDGTIFLRTALIREAHAPPIFAHQGQNKCVKMLEREYFWPGMKRTIRQYISNCHECRRNKTVHDKTPGLLHSLPLPNTVWDQVVVDGKDMPQDEYGYDYVWEFICKFSRLLARLPGKKTDTAEILAIRYYRYLYRFLGMPAI